MGDLCAPSTLNIEEGCVDKPSPSLKSQAIQVEIMERLWRPRDHLLHAALMAVSYDVVASRKVWHALRLYHRAVMVSFDSEALAEHAGSLMRYVERRHSVGRALELPKLVQAVRLRSLGLRGDLSDAGLIRRALQEMFGDKDKHLDSHFLVGQRAAASRSVMLGPSIALHRFRERIAGLFAARFRFSWLLRGGHVGHVERGLDLNASASSALRRPPDVSDVAWGTVRHHVECIAPPLKHCA